MQLECEPPTGALHSPNIMHVVFTGSVACRPQPCGLHALPALLRGRSRSMIYANQYLSATKSQLLAWKPSRFLCSTFSGLRARRCEDNLQRCHAALSPFNQDALAWSQSRNQQHSHTEDTDLTEVPLRRFVYPEGQSIRVFSWLISAY